MPVLPSARFHCAPTGVGRRPLAAALCVAAAVLGGCTIALPGWLGGGGTRFVTFVTSSRHDSPLAACGSEPASSSYSTSPSE